MQHLQKIEGGGARLPRAAECPRWTPAIRDDILRTSFSKFGVFHGSQKTLIAAIRLSAGPPCLWSAKNRSQAQAARHRAGREWHGVGHDSSASAERPDAQFGQRDRARCLREAS